MEVKIVDHFLVKKLGSDVFTHNFEFGDDLLFDSDTGFVVKLGVLLSEEFLVFLMGQVGSHFGDQLNGNNLILLIIIVAHLNGCLDDLLFLLGREPVF